MNNSIFQILLADLPRILHSGIIINLNDCRRNIGSIKRALLFRPDSAKNHKKGQKIAKKGAKWGKQAPYAGLITY